VWTPTRGDLARTKAELAIGLPLGRVNGHLTVEQGTPAEVEAEVAEAMRVLAPGGGFILSPVDNVREDTPTARTNVSALIAAWRGAAGGS